MEKSVKIFIVEDEALTALFLKLQLGRKGYEVSKIIATGEELINIIQTEVPDIILMDIHLAGTLDGIETAEKIMKICPVRIIFLTGFSDDNQKERAFKVNPLGYFEKPVEILDICKCINTAMITNLQN